MESIRKVQDSLRDSVIWLMDLTSQSVEPIWLALLSYFRQMWDYFGLTLHLCLVPDERLGREAVDIFLIGTVPAFLLRSTSAPLLLGVVPGFIAGLGLMVAFSHCQTSRSRKRRMKTGLIHMISEMNKDDYRSLFPKSVFPRWIEFSDLDKVEWVNSVMKKIWPFFNEAYSKMLMKRWEPYLDSHKPAFVNLVAFHELTLGSVAPQFEGLRMLSLDPKEISTDVNTRWFGNASCTLSVSTIMGVSFPLQVKDIHLKGVFRFIFKPLVDELPGFGAVTYSIRKKKKFDFVVMVVGGDISNVPGMVQKLHQMVQSAVLESLSWPRRICIPIIPTSAVGGFTKIRRHLCPRRNAAFFAAPGAGAKPPLGILDLRLVQGRDLRDRGKSPDPFALVYIHATPGHIRKSTTIKRENNPIWNEFFELEFDDLEDGKVMVVLLDEAAPQEFQVLGYCQFFLQALEEGRITERWLKVYKDMQCHGSLHDGEYRGQVNIEFLHRSYDREEIQSFQDVARDSLPTMDLEGWNRRRISCLSSRFSRKGRMWELIRGILTVTVVRAENLLPTDFHRKSDPYVVLYMIKHKRLRKKTTVIHSNLNPVWDESFEFQVEDASQDMLLLHVWNHDPFGKDYLGSTATTLTPLLEESIHDRVCRLVGVPCGILILRLEWKSNTEGSSEIFDRPEPPASTEYVLSSNKCLQLCSN